MMNKGYWLLNEVLQEHARRENRKRQLWTLFDVNASTF